MERREFLRAAATVSAITALTPSALVLEGCSVDIKGLINVVLNSADAIIKVAEPNAPWLQPLEAAIVALQQAEQQWSAGGAVQILVSALNTIEAVLAVIPVTAQYSPLIAVLVAGIEAVLTALFPNQPAPVTATKNPYLAPKYKVALNKPHVFQTYQGAYRSQWNATAEKIGLSRAKI